jgi:uncharacterized membrane protein
VALILAQETLEKGIWYPTILGVLVVVAAVVLFIGSVYVLLGTNLGARLGFLVTFTGLTGFMVILTLLWCTTASPLNTIKGRIPQWKVQEVIATPAKSKTSDVHNIKQDRFKADATEASNVKAAVDAALVTKVSTPTVKYTPNDNRFAKFDTVTDYMIVQTWEIGGSKPQFWKGEFTHTPQYAVVQFCQVIDTSASQPFGLPPIPPECDNSAGAIKGYVVLFRDLGSLRVPAFVAFGMSLLLFILGLVMLHWREKDEREREAASEAEASGPVAVPDRDESELTKV